MAKATRWFGALSYFLFFLVLGAWGGLYFYNSQLKDQISKIGEEIDAVALSLEDKEGQIQKINEANEKLNILGNVINSHIYFSNALKELEKTTLKAVYFKKFGFSAEKNILSLSGSTNSHTNFSKQVSVFKSQSDIFRNVKIGQINIPRDEIEFDLEMALSGGVLSKK